MKIKMKKILNALVEIVKDTLKKFINLKYEFSIICICMMIIIQLLEDKKTTVLILQIVFFCICIICQIADRIEKKIKFNESGFPKAVRRYTYKDKNGNVIVKEEDITLAIAYLCELEEYLERYE